MTTQEQLTPQGFRTAAYLEARARMDFVRSRSGKTNRKVQCKPPNTKCGGRCIPPEWDCRLKGEGADPKLRAVKFDPVGGLANVQRGVGRFVKGIQRGNFSEIEGGKRSLIRGTVKLTPGNIQKKEELRTWLEDNFIKAGVAIAVLGGAGGLHYAMYSKNTFGYKYGAGRKINEAAERGVNTVLDFVPVWGAERTRVRTVGQRAAEGITTRARQTVQGGPSAQVQTLGRGSESLLSNRQAVSPVDDGRRALTEALNKVDEAAKKDNFYNWNQRHRESFWGTKRDGHSIYSEHATNQFLSDVYRVPQANRGSAESIRYAIQNQIEIDRISLLDLARQEGYKTTFTNQVERLKPEDAADFARRIVKRSSGVAPEVSEKLQTQIRRTLADTPFTTASRIYRETQLGYDDYFKRVSELNQVTAGIPLNADQRAKGQDTVIKTGDTRRSEFLLRRMRRSGQPAGPSHVELINRDYYHTRVAGTPKSQYPITDRLAQSSAVEMSGRQTMGVAEAFDYLNSQGYRVTRVRQAGAPKPTPKRAPAKPESEFDKQARKSRTDLIQRLVEEGYTRETAARMVDENRVPIDMFDEASPRVDAYLEARARLDKRCGKSGIPDTKKCSKPTAAQSEAARNRERGLKTPGVTCTPPNKQCGNLCIPPTATCHVTGGGPKAPGGGGLVSTIGKAALTAGALAGGAAAFKNRRFIRKQAGLAGKVIKTERNTYRALRNKNLSELNAYGRKKYTRSQAGRAAQREYFESRRQLAEATYKQYAPRVLNTAIKRLSDNDVRIGLSKLPKQFQPQASGLLGKAKSGLAHMSADAQGFKVRSINNKSNFSILSNDDNSKIITIGSVGDTLVTFNADKSSLIDLKTETGRGVSVYDIQFQTDLGFDQKKGLNRKDQIAVGTMIKSMNVDSMKTLPKNAVLRNIPYADDGLGRKRGAIYKKFGYKSLKGIRGQAMFATLSNGKVVPIDSKYEGFYADLLKGDSYEQALEKFTAGPRKDSVQTLARLDKKCGKTGIPDNRKCTKPIVQRIAETALIGGGLTAAGFTALSLLRGRNKGVAPISRVKTSSISKLEIPTNKKASEWHDNLYTIPGMHEGHRQRKYDANLKMRAIGTSEIVKNVKAIADTPEGQLVARLIERQQLRFDPKIAENLATSKVATSTYKSQIKAFIDANEVNPQFEGFYLDPNWNGNNGATKNTIYLNFRRNSSLEWQPDKKSITEGITTFLDARARTTPGTAPLPSEKAKMTDFVNSYTSYSPASADNRDFILGIHEMGHAIDLVKGQKRYPSMVSDSATGRRVSTKSPAFKMQAAKVTSTYGLSDIDDSRNEFFAENFTLYTLAPTRLKKDAPLIYDWVDQYLKTIDASN